MATALRAKKPKPWTGEALLDRVLFWGGYQPTDVADSVQALREALKAETLPRYSTEGTIVCDSGPDHSTRIAAAKALISLPLTGYKRPDDAPANGPVSVNIVLANANANGHPRALPDADGVRIHLGGGNGGGA